MTKDEGRGKIKSDASWSIGYKGALLVVLAMGKIRTLGLSVENGLKRSSWEGVAAVAGPGRQIYNVHL